LAGFADKRRVQNSFCQLFVVLPWKIQHLKKEHFRNVRAQRLQAMVGLTITLLNEKGFIIDKGGFSTRKTLACKTEYQCGQQFMSTAWTIKHSL